mmetsp:Transcript_8781/g.24317  ORF Transcript_8781/g.24317 Transcript_8781/m.24317 type:complete len:216 (+) Transcript_8781:393-1040(+)
MFEPLVPHAPRARRGQSLHRCIPLGLAALILLKHQESWQTTRIVVVPVVVLVHPRDNFAVQPFGINEHECEFVVVLGCASFSSRDVAHQIRIAQTGHVGLDDIILESKAHLEPHGPIKFHGPHAKGTNLRNPRGKGFAAQTVVPRRGVNGIANRIKGEVRSRQRCHRVGHDGRPEDGHVAQVRVLLHILYQPVVVGRRWFDKDPMEPLSLLFVGQ